MVLVQIALVELHHIVAVQGGVLIIGGFRLIFDGLDVAGRALFIGQPFAEAAAAEGGIGAVAVVGAAIFLYQLCHLLGVARLHGCFQGCCALLGFLFGGLGFFFRRLYGLAVLVLLCLGLYGHFVSLILEGIQLRLVLFVILFRIFVRLLIGLSDLLLVLLCQLVFQGDLLVGLLVHIPAIGVLEVVFQGVAILLAVLFQICDGVLYLLLSLLAEAVPFLFRLLHQDGYIGQLLLGAGDADIGQTALFLQICLGVFAHLAGEHPLLHANEEHIGEFQTLCRVDGHQDHLVSALVVAVNVADEGDILQVAFQ